MKVRNLVLEIVFLGPSYPPYFTINEVKDQFHIEWYLTPVNANVCCCGNYALENTASFNSVLKACKFQLIGLQGIMFMYPVGKVVLILFLTVDVNNLACANILQ